MLRNDIAVDAFTFFREPFDERRGVNYLTHGLLQRLALLRRHHSGEIFLIFHHQIEPIAKDRGAFLCRLGAPGGIGLVRRLDRLSGFVSSHFRDRA